MELEAGGGAGGRAGRRAATVHGILGFLFFGIFDFWSLRDAPHTPRAHTAQASTAHWLANRHRHRRTGHRGPRTASARRAPARAHRRAVASARAVFSFTVTRRRPRTRIPLASLASSSITALRCRRRAVRWGSPSRPASSAARSSCDHTRSRGAPDQLAELGARCGSAECTRCGPVYK